MFSIRLSFTGTTNSKCMYILWYDRDNLTLASLLVAVEEVVGLLLTRPLKVQWKDDERRKESSPDESAVVDAEGLQNKLMSD